MQHITTTPFGRRPVTADLVANQALAEARPSVPHFDKWALFRDLCSGRHNFGLSDRDLTVLNALLSFHSGSDLSDNQNLIVFPSNAALAQRAHGMAESTLRRHLAALVRAGVVLRHDSPNGKRYAARDAEGELVRAFGFDLRPLLVRAAEITDAASQARAAELRVKRIREEAVLMCRDLVKLNQYGQEEITGQNWDAYEDQARLHQRALRRKLGVGELEEILADLRETLTLVRAVVSGSFASGTEEMSGNDVLSERHHHNSNTDSHDFEPRSEECEGGGVDVPETTVPKVEPDRNIRMPLGLVLKACPDLLDYGEEDIRHWHQFVARANFVRSMLGISVDAWAQAQMTMGPENAATVLACILQRADEINSPGGYLRALTRKAQDHAFSTGPMVMALLNSTEGKAA